MAVTMARDTWTDDRLDDLNKRVDGGFTEMQEEFRAVRAEMREEFRAVRAEMREEFRAMRAEMAAGRRAMMQMAGGIWMTSVVGFLGVIATVVAHG
jgi:hypothetical protein